MGWKRYDWSCTSCGRILDRLVWVEHGHDAPRVAEYACPGCGVTECERLISAPAQYLGDRPMRPVVHGGRFDTAGRAPLPDYPELRGGSRWETREREGRPVRTEVVSGEALIDHVNTKEWTEVHREREAILATNAEKQRRLPALKAGKVDLRNSKAPGDPRLTEKRKATRTCQTKIPATAAAPAKGK